MSLNDWYSKAMSHQTYIDAMESNKEGLLHIYNSFATPDDQDFFNNLKEKNLRVIVLTEDWCGDAMMNTPILLRLAEKTNMEVRMLLRDSNLELMDNYLTNGKSRSIPIFIFIDEDGKEAAKWGPRAKEVQQFVEEVRSGLPDKDAEDYQDKHQEVIQKMTETFKTDGNLWNAVYTSLKNTLSTL
jgi:thiol-disulfide isomerase/thioredoxin